VLFENFIFTDGSLAFGLMLVLLLRHLCQLVCKTLIKFDYGFVLGIQHCNRRDAFLLFLQLVRFNSVRAHLVDVLILHFFLFLLKLDRDFHYFFDKLCVLHLQVDFFELLQFQEFLPLMIVYLKLVNFIVKSLEGTSYRFNRGRFQVVLFPFISIIIVKLQRLGQFILPLNYPSFLVGACDLGTWTRARHKIKSGSV